MFKKIISSLPKGRKAATTESPAATVDLSRVIKQAPVSKSEEQPEPAAELQDVMEPAAVAETEADIVAPAPKQVEGLGALAEEAVESLASRFEIWMRVDLDTLTDAWKTAQQPGATPDKYRAVFTAAHNIKGAAPSYGYPAISRLCSSLCTLLADTQPGENSALINLHVEACRAAFNSPAAGSGADSVADAVCDALEQSVALRSAQGWKP